LASWKNIESGTGLSAIELEVVRTQLNRILCQSAVSPEMSLRLSKALSRSPESWQAMQHSYGLWLAKKKLHLGKASKVKLNAA